jgi:ADP-ribose pyrophosphatase
MFRKDISRYYIATEKRALGREGVKLLSTRKIYEGNISIRIDRYKLNDNVIEKEVIEHPTSVCLVPILHGTHVLFVKQYRHAARKYTLEIPAGKAEKGETPKEAAVREMREEIGYVGTLLPILRWYLAPGYSTELMYVFVATHLRKVKECGEHRDDDEQNISLRCMKLTTAIRKCIAGGFEDCKTVAALLCYAKLSKMRQTILPH